MKNSLKFLKTAGPELQHKINKSIIFHYLRENSPISRAAISKELKISAPAVSRVIEKLILEGFVLEKEKQETKSGKRPTLLEINKHKGLVLGIDLGTEKITVAVMNYKGDIIRKYFGDKINDSSEIQEKILDEISMVLEDCKNNKLGLEINPKINAICIAIPADVDPVTGKITGAPLYGSWKDLNLKEIIKSSFDIPVYIENNVNLAVWGEKKSGLGKNYNSLAFIEVSNGVAAGIIIDNSLHRGENGYSGEIGFTIIGSENLGFEIKNKGFLEKTASITSIHKRILESLKPTEKSMILGLAGNDYGKITPALICEAAIKKDIIASEAINNSVKFLSIAIINLILILNPQIIVMGGYICNLPFVNELFIEPIKAYVKKSIPFGMPGIELSNLGDEAGIIGACYMAMESVLTNEFPYKIDA